MIQNYNLKLGALALAQESMKGFDSGIPQVAQPYMDSIGLTPDDLMLAEPPTPAALQQFKGGGTYFPKFKHLANPKEIGMCTLHPGNITHKHGARPVTKGTRYVVVSFIKSGSHK